jgi:hypothetical protein
VSAAPEQVQQELVPAPIEGELIVKNEVLENARTAVTVIDKLAAGMAELRSEYGGKVYEVATTKGDEEARKARLALRQVRSNLEAARKKGKRLLIDLGKDIDSRAESTDADLLALIDPIDAQIKAEEDRKEEIKNEKIRAEQERVDKLRARIADIQAMPARLTGKPAVDLAAAVEELSALDVSEASFADWAGTAATAHAAALSQLQRMRAERIAADEEAERVRLAQEAADKARAEEDARLAEQRRQQEAREKELADQQAAIDKARREQEERERADREAAEQRQREEEARLEARRQELADAERAQQERLAAEQRARVEDAERVRRENERQARVAAENNAWADVRLMLVDQKVAASDAGGIEALQVVLNAIEAIVVDRDALGDWYLEARDLKSDIRAAVTQRIVKLDNERIASEEAARLAAAPQHEPDPAPTAAEPLTVAPSQEGAGAATAAPVAAEGPPMAFEEPDYPGDEAIEQAVATQFAQSHLVARIWLRRYAEQVAQ